MNLIEVCQWVLLFWFLLLPAPFPWYAVVLAALLPATPRFALTAPAVVALSGAAGLYYLSFYYEYQRLPDDLVDLDPAGRARLDLGHPGLRSGS